MRLNEFTVDNLSATTYSPVEIAKFHNVSPDLILAELYKGIQVEMEHTSNQQVAREIALDHLLELPDYYTRLAKMELDETTTAGAIATVVSGPAATITRNASIYGKQKNVKGKSK